MRPSFCVQSRSACILGHEVRLMMRLHVHKKEIRYKYLDKLTIWKLKLYIFGDISRPWHRITAIAENHSNRGDREFVIYIHPYPIPMAGWRTEELEISNSPTRFTPSNAESTVFYFRYLYVREICYFVSWIGTLFFLLQILWNFMVSLFYATFNISLHNTRQRCWIWRVLRAAAFTRFPVMDLTCKYRYSRKSRTDALWPTHACFVPSFLAS